MSVTIAFCLPAGTGYDEEDHIARTDQLLRGEIFASEVARGDVENKGFYNADSSDPLYGGYVDKALVEQAFSAKNDFFVNSAGSEYSFPPWTNDTLTTESVYGSSEILFVFSNTAINSPIAYLPQTIALFVGRLFTDDPYALIMIIRLVQALACGLAFFFAIRIIPLGKWLLAVVCLLPITVTQSSTVTADAMCNIVCLLFLTSVLNILLSDSGTKRTAVWIVLACSMVLLGLVKMSYIPLILLSALIPAFRNEYRKRKCYLLLGGSAALSIILFILWYELAASGVNTGAMFVAEVHPDMQLDWMLLNPFSYAVILLNSFLSTDFFQMDSLGPLSSHGMEFLYPSWVTVMLFIVGVLFPDNERKLHRLTIGQSFTLSASLWAEILIIFILAATALYLQFNAVGSMVIAGLQSRYFIPLIILFPLSILIPYRCISAKSCNAENDAVLSKTGAFAVVILEMISLLALIYGITLAIY